MTTAFFFGTLRHVPLLEVVMGASAHDLDISTGQLPDHEVRGVQEGPFPTLVHAPQGTADGIVVENVTEAQRARLDFYEGAFDYALQSHRLSDGRMAEVYFPPAERWTAAGPWDLGDWQAQWGGLSTIAAGEVMGYLGQRAPSEIAQMFPMIRARAVAQMLAKQSKHGAGTLQGTVEVSDRRRSYANFFALDEFSLRHQRFDGTMSPRLERAVFIATDAAIVLPYDPVRDRVMVIEQMRMGPLARGDVMVWQMEPIAGRIDAGETPQEAALRETREEAGLEVSRLEPVAETYASPGNATEFHHIFVGIADLPDEAAGVAGKEDEAEDIRSHVMSFDALMEMVDTLQAANAPLALAALWLARHRTRLRGAA